MVLPVVICGSRRGGAAWTPASAYGADLLLWQTATPETATKVGGGTLANGDRIATLTGREGTIGSTMIVGDEPRYDVVGGVGYANPTFDAVQNYGTLDSNLVLPDGDWTIYWAGKYVESNDLWFGDAANQSAVSIGFITPTVGIAAAKDAATAPTVIFDPPPAGTVGVSCMRRSGSDLYFLPAAGVETSTGLAGLAAVTLDLIFNNNSGQGHTSLWHEFVVVNRAVTADENTATMAYLNAGLGV